MASMPSLKHGNIVRVRLDPVERSEQIGERPALVISPDVINEHSRDPDRCADESKDRACVSV